MTSVIGQKCRTIADKAASMKNPCIQITPILPPDKGDGAMVYYNIYKFSKKLEEKYGVPFVVDVVESDREPQCKDSTNGYHEFHEFNDEDNKTILFCIHCGMLSSVTRRSSEELNEFFQNKRFKMSFQQKNENQ